MQNVSFIMHSSCQIFLHSILISIVIFFKPPHISSSFSSSVQSLFKSAFKVYFSIFLRSSPLTTLRRPIMSTFGCYSVHSLKWAVIFIWSVDKNFNFLRTTFWCQQLVEQTYDIIVISPRIVTVVIVMTIVLTKTPPLKDFGPNGPFKINYPF